MLCRTSLPTPPVASTACMTTTHPCRPTPPSIRSVLKNVLYRDSSFSAYCIWIIECLGRAIKCGSVCRNAFAYVKIRERLAVPERVRGKRDASENTNVGQRITVSECALTESGDRCGKNYRFERGAAFEGSFSDICHVCGNSDIFKLFAESKFMMR